MSDVVGDPVVEARAAYQRREWESAYQLFKARDATRPLPPEDLERLSWAAYWAGRYAEAMALLERAGAAYGQAGDSRGAARVTMHQARLQFEHLNPAIATGLWARAARLLADQPECAEHAVQAWTTAAFALGRGDVETAREQAERACAIGRRVGDRDSEAMGLLWLGHVYMAEDRVAEGIALHDEATAAATSGELGPLIAGFIYCNVILACRSRADWRRAAEWTERADRWCERESVGFFPGACRVHRAEILRLRGALRDAERDVLEGCELLMAASPFNAAIGFQELAEIRLRLGDLAGAEEACRNAVQLGRQPQPVLALLRLAQGDPKGALAAIDRSLDDPGTWHRENHANLLPAKVSIALAAGDQVAARNAVTELEALAAALGTPAPAAAAACARGEVELAAGRSGQAIVHLRQSVPGWCEVQAPYEAARAQCLLATAYKREGDLGAATMELASALSSFEKLGAELDARRARELLAGIDARRGGESPPARLTKTFMFTDIVDSTRLVEMLGDQAWDSLQRWHHRTLRTCFEEHGGEEVDHAGDGFFVAFPAAEAALECAIAIQRALARHRTEHGFAPQVRIGLHVAEALQRDGDYAGRGVHVAARVAAAGGAGEILASRDAVAAAGGRFSSAGERLVELKGLAAPLTVARIDW
jgi:class 3 adenylate cyclase